MPGIHERSVAAHAARNSSVDWDDVELAIRPHQLAIAALYENDPAAVGRYLREIVAHAVVGGTENRFGLAALSVIEGYAVEAVLDLYFVGIVGVGRRLLAIR